MENMFNSIDTLAIETGSNGRKYALAHRTDGFSVYVLCENYAGHVRGGIARTWRVACYKDKARRGKMVTKLTKEDALAYFNKLTGKAVV